VLISQQINEMNDSQFWVNDATSGSSTTDGTSFTTGSFSSTTSLCMLLSVVSTHASAAAKPASFTGAHTDTLWTELQTIAASDGTARLTQYFGRPLTTPQTGTLQINFDTTMTGCLWSVAQVFDGDTAFTFAPGESCLFAAGTYSSGAVSGNTVDVIPNMPATGKILAMTGPGAGGYTPWSGGWPELVDISIATPTQGLGVHWSRHTGDMHGRALFADTIAQRLAGLVAVQSADSNRNKSIVLRYHGVKEVTS
jgi:hypothetical protein